DRPVGVALLEGHDDLLADARDVDRPPLVARPCRPDADPARAVGVVLPLAVPVKLDLHPPILIGEDLLALRAADDRRLRPLHDRPRRGPPGAERHLGRDAPEAVAIAELHPHARAVIATQVRLVADIDEDVIAIGVGMTAQGELVAAGEVTAMAG